MATTTFSGPIKAGTVRAIAVTGAQRHASLPEVPTLIESGMNDMDISIWTGFVAPAATPIPIVP